MTLLYRFSSSLLLSSALTVALINPGVAGGIFEVSLPVTDQIALGIEAHGEIDGAFGDTASLDEQEHFIGPAAYFEIDVSDDLVIEPRAAVLFGLTEEAPDAIFSLNLEFEFGGEGDDD